jgi:hypothetical protein
LLNKVSNDPANLEAWKDILTWSRRVIGQLRRSGKRHNAAAVVKKRIVEFDSVDFEVQSSGSNGKVKSTKSTDFRLAEAVAAKLEDGNLRAAVRLLMSDDKPADVSSETPVKLIEKHPPAPAIRQFPDSSPAVVPASVDEDIVLRALRSFPAGSSGGPDGFRPQQLLDLVCNREGGPDLLSALTGFVNLLLQGRCQHEIVPILFGGRLVALNKSSGGIRLLVTHCVD